MPNIAQKFPSNVSREPPAISEIECIKEIVNKIGGRPYQVILAGNGYKAVSATAEGATATLEPLAGAAGLFRLNLENPKTGETPWTVTFSRP